MSGGLEEVLRRIQGGSDQPAVVELPSSIAIQKLTEAAERYNAPCPFTISQMITPRSDSHIPGHGHPFVVLEILDEPLRPRGSTQNTISSSYNAKFDIRVGHIYNGVIAAHCVESWEFEVYTGPAVSADTPRN